VAVRGVKPSRVTGQPSVVPRVFVPVLLRIGLIESVEDLRPGGDRLNRSVIRQPIWRLKSYSEGVSRRDNLLRIENP
jgi:hypothetical protein